MKPVYRVINWGTGDKCLIFDLTTFCREHPCRVVISANSRKALARVLIKFRQARRSIGTTSTTILSGLYEAGSLRWIACHSGKIIDVEKQKIIRFKNPNLRKIIHWLETI